MNTGYQLDAKVYDILDTLLKNNDEKIIHKISSFLNMDDETNCVNCDGVMIDGYHVEETDCNYWCKDCYDKASNCGGCHDKVAENSEEYFKCKYCNFIIHDEDGCNDDHLIHFTRYGDVCCTCVEDALDSHFGAKA